MDERIEYDSRDSLLLRLVVNIFVVIVFVVEIFGRVQAVLRENDAELGADERSFVAFGNLVEHSQPTRLEQIQSPNLVSAFKRTFERKYR